MNLDQRIIDNLFNMELSHRQPEFDELSASVRRRLYVAGGFDADRHLLSLMHGSGTLAVDAALTSLVRGRVLVLDNGLYCRRLALTLEGTPAAEVEVVHHPIGQPLDLDVVRRRLAQGGIDWIAAVHHETTTGLLNPLPELVELAEQHEARLFIDAVSSFAAHSLDPRIDVVCFNSSKCLESLPGIAGIFWGSDIESDAVVPVLDVAAYSMGTASTPNVQAFVALDVALDILAAEDRSARYERLARHVWEVGSQQFEMLLPEGDRSHVLTSFRLAGRDPDAVFRRALEAGLVIYHGQQELRREIFRVANMGAAMTESAIEQLFEVLAA